MNVLLIFFAIPIATIILSAILETFINCPYKVAGIFFSIFIVVAFALGGTAEYLVAAIVYTIISFIVAYIVMILQNRNCCRNECESNCRNNCRDNNCNAETFENSYNLNNSFSGFNTPNAFSLNNEIVQNNITENDNFPQVTNNTNCSCRRYR